MATPHSQYLAAQALTRHCSAQLEATWQHCDVLLSLSAPGEAPEGLHSTGDSVFNRNWTLLGVPCVHLPTAAGPQGLPLGVTLIGPLGSDVALLGAALWAAGLWVCLIGPMAWAQGQTPQLSAAPGMVSSPLAVQMPPSGICTKPLYLTFDTGHMGVADLIADVLRRQQVKVLPG